MKSPNTDSKRHRQARNCWNCDNGDVIGRVSQCCCKERSRAANKKRWKDEVEKQLIELRNCGRYYPFIGPQF